MSNVKVSLPMVSRQIHKVVILSIWCSIPMLKAATEESPSTGGNAGPNTGTGTCTEDSKYGLNIGELQMVHEVDLKSKAETGDQSFFARLCCGCCGSPDETTSNQAKVKLHRVKVYRGRDKFKYPNEEEDVITLLYDDKDFIKIHLRKLQCGSVKLHTCQELTKNYQLSFTKTTTGHENKQFLSIRGPEGPEDDGTIIFCRSEDNIDGKHRRGRDAFFDIFFRLPANSYEKGTATKLLAHNDDGERTELTQRTTKPRAEIRIGQEKLKNTWITQFKNAQHHNIIMAKTTREARDSKIKMLIELCNQYGKEHPKFVNANIAFMMYKANSEYHDTLCKWDYIRSAYDDEEGLSASQIEGLQFHKYFLAVCNRPGCPLSNVDGDDASRVVEDHLPEVTRISDHPGKCPKCRQYTLSEAGDTKGSHIYFHFSIPSNPSKDRPKNHTRQLFGLSSAKTPDPRKKEGFTEGPTKLKYSAYINILNMIMNTGFKCKTPISRDRCPEHPRGTWIEAFFSMKAVVDRSLFERKHKGDRYEFAMNAIFDFELTWCEMQALANFPMSVFYDSATNRYSDDAQFREFILGYNWKPSKGIFVKRREPLPNIHVNFMKEFRRLVREIYPYSEYIWCPYGGSRESEAGDDDDTCTASSERRAAVVSNVGSDTAASDDSNTEKDGYKL